MELSRRRRILRIQHSVLPPARCYHTADAGLTWDSPGCWCGLAAVAGPKCGGTPLTAAAAVDWDTGTCVGEEGDYQASRSKLPLGLAERTGVISTLSLAHSSHCRTADKACLVFGHFRILHNRGRFLRLYQHHQNIELGYFLYRKVEPLSDESNPGVASLSGVGGW